MSTRLRQHPSHLLARLGVSERPAAYAIGLIALFQYLFLLKLWEGYPARWSGELVRTEIVVVCAGLSVAGAAALVAMSLRRWRATDAATRRLTRPAIHPSFDPIRAGLTSLARRSTLNSTPGLLYSLTNATALQVQDEGTHGTQAVVVGLALRDKQREDPLVFTALVGHELSHLELARTRAEIITRRVVFLHFGVLSWLLLAFLVVIGFIDRTGGSADAGLRSWLPSVDPTIYLGLSAQFAALALSSAVVFAYSYFFVVRREHIHDIRGSQLAATDALARHVFARLIPTGILTRYLHAIGDFVRIHPSAAARRRVVVERDVLLLSAVVYPLIVTGVQPLSMLLTAGWRSYFSLDERWWNVGVTIMSGGLLYASLSADIARLALGLLLRKRSWIRIALYATVAGFATQIPRVVLEIIFGMRRGFPIGLIVERIWVGSLIGGARIAVMVTALLIILAYLCSARIAAVGEAASGKWSRLYNGGAAVIVIGAFTIASLTSAIWIVHILAVVAGIGGGLVALFVLGTRCTSCGRMRRNALSLRARCACGHDLLHTLRHWFNQPYESHLDPEPTPLTHGAVDKR